MNGEIAHTFHSRPERPANPPGVEVHQNDLVLDDDSQHRTVRRKSARRRIVEGQMTFHLTLSDPVELKRSHAIDGLDLAVDIWSRCDAETQSKENDEG
jgi:hypothetical protein